MPLTPQYTISTKINNNIAELERIRTFLNLSPILPEIELNLRFRATVEATYGSTSVEGNPLNKNQVKKVIQGRPITAPDYALQEVLNYQQALQWLNQQADNLGKIDQKTILKLHKLALADLLPKEKLGHWRPGKVFIVNEKNGQEVVVYTAPEAEKVEELISQLLHWIDQASEAGLHLIIIAGILHYVFLAIHPFSDGNGRTTRLLVRLYLQMFNYDFKQLLALDAFYLQHRAIYYQKLSLGKNFKERLAADLTPFLEFFTFGFVSVAQQLKHDISVAGVIVQDGKPLRLDHDEIQILDYTRQFGNVTSQEVYEFLEVSYRTAQRKLQGLVEKELLKRLGKGRASHYVLK